MTIYCFKMQTLLEKIKIFIILLYKLTYMLYKLTYMLYKLISSVYYFIDSLRSFFWSLLGGRLWKKVKIARWVLMANPRRIFIWDWAKIGSYSLLEWWTSWNKWLYIWKAVWINRFCRFAGEEDIIIKDYVQIWSNVTILSSDHNTKKDKYIKYSGYISKPVLIEEDVWIGSNVMILPWVTIWRGAIVGANAVVTKNIPNYAIVGGVPAKIIKFRT